MFSKPRSSPSRESHAIGTRFWLYLGSVAVGFALMALEDPGAQERPVDGVEQSAPSSAGEMATKRPASPPSDVSTLHSVSAELVRHGATITAK